MKGSTRLVIVILVCSLVVASLGSPASAAPPTSIATHVPGEVIVFVRPGADAAAVAASLRAAKRTELPALGATVLQVAPGTEEAVALALAKDGRVAHVELNWIASTTVVPNDPAVPKQWAWGKIQAFDAWNITTGSPNVKVAVVDTGIDSSHPDLPAPILQKDFVNGDNDATDDNGHGTHVAGTIGALTNTGDGVAGLNWHVSLMAAKVMDQWGNGSYSNIAAGIIWAADNGARVINLSLGGTFPSTVFENAINYAWSKGAVVVCAAGNNGTSAKFYPAAYENCIAVASTDTSDGKSTFSNYGSQWVDVAAPGESIYSTYLGGTYGYNSGTSMAAPHVSGLAALVWAKGACTTNKCVRRKVEGSADRVAGTGTYWKWGRINAFKAVK